MPVQPPYPPFDSKIGEYELDSSELKIFQGRYSLGDVADAPSPLVTSGLRLQGDISLTNKDFVLLSGDQKDVSSDGILLEGSYE